ncbi:MAG TPA: hypothetical protein VE995_08435 [Gaiellaceae bacterium]|nr:hypothetical protein [Gaiellaceae bacterium]
MDAARALADLLEISPQLETAAVLGADGGLLGSAGLPPARTGVLARAVGELLQAAGGLRRGEAAVTQLHASLRDGEVFAVTGRDGRTIVAAASGAPSPGLVFYDLKRCLASLAEDDAPAEPAEGEASAEPAEDEAPPPAPAKPKRRRRAKEADAET